MYRQGPLSPNSLFFAMMMGSFLVAAIIHPQEFSCIIPLPLYMMLIPSMYMLLSIYSVTNMHNVTWGTRDAKTELSAKEIAQQEAKEAERRRLEEAERRKKEAANKKGGSFFRRYVDVGGQLMGGSKNGLFTCMCCSGGLHGLEVGGTISEMAKSLQELKIVVEQMKSQRDSVEGPR